VGIQALLEAERGVEVIAEAAHVGVLPNLPQEVDVVLATSGAGSLQEWQQALSGSPPSFSLLWIAEGPEGAGLPRELPVLAWGILSPEASQEELVAAIWGLHFGLIVAPPEFLEPLLAPNVSLDEEGYTEPLTPRELEVLQLLADGLANKQIALKLEISEHTVKFHISSIYKKLGATNRAEAVRLGLKLGLILL
jgi:DNA-binding NarL/FixJ family response regulator